MMKLVTCVPHFLIIYWYYKKIENTFIGENQWVQKTILTVQDEYRLPIYPEKPARKHTLQEDSKRGGEVIKLLFICILVIEIEIHYTREL